MALLITSNYLLKFANSCTSLRSFRTWGIFTNISGAERGHLDLFGMARKDYCTVQTGLEVSTNPNVRPRQCLYQRAEGKAPRLALLNPPISPLPGSEGRWQPCQVLSPYTVQLFCFFFPPEEQSPALQGWWHLSSHSSLQILCDSSPNTPVIPPLSLQHSLPWHCLSCENWVIKFSRGER